MFGIAGILLGILASCIPCPAPAQAQERAETTALERVVVGPGGLLLYPRFNRSLAPLARLEPGRVLRVLRSFHAWKEVEVETTKQRGWIWVEVKPEASGFSKGYDTVAAPSVAGLVARGWSRRYAASRGADFEKVEALEKRRLDPARYEKFLQEKKP